MVRGCPLAVAGGLAGCGGTAGAVGGSATGGALVAWIGAASLAVVVAPAVVGGVVGAVGATVAFRKLYGSARGMGEMALKRLLHAVAVEAEGQH